MSLTEIYNTATLWTNGKYKHNAGKQQLLVDYAITKLQSGCWPKGSLFMNVGYKCWWMHIKAI